MSEMLQTTLTGMLGITAAGVATNVGQIAVHFSDTDEFKTVMALASMTVAFLTIVSLTLTIKSTLRWPTEKRRDDSSNGP